MSALLDQTVFVKLTHISCGLCQFHFAMDDSWYQKCMDDHDNSFFCPKCGKCLQFTGATEATKLRRELAAKQAEVERKQREVEAELERSKKLRTSLDRQKRMTAAQKGAKTRALTRIHNGVCPCCNRTFYNLKWHMESKHPDFKPATYDAQADKTT